MFVIKVVAAVSFMMAIYESTSGHPQPGVIRERLIIKTPIKYKTIHHYRVLKIPVIIRKHIHYFKDLPESNHPVEESDSNHIYHHNGDDHADDHVDYYEDHHEEDYGGHSNHDEASYYKFNNKKDEDYEENSHEDYKDYEYE